MKKMSTIVTMVLLFCGLLVHAQGPISGVISDAEVNPIPGATIIVSGTTIGTTSDFDGNFSINADAQASLEFSSIGFETQIVVLDGQTSLTISLQDSVSQLDEIIITGYGKQAALNCDNKSPKLYTGIEVGFSSLCIDKEITFEFLDDVIREISAITPGEYFHIGGDESHATKEADYVIFINRAQDIVEKYGKKVIGWDEIQSSKIKPNTIVQYWADLENAKGAIHKGAKILMSPAKYAYLDMQYDSLSAYGLHWAYYISIKKGYDWILEQLVDGIFEENIIGIEAPLSSETITNFEELSYLAFPRILGYAEIGWSNTKKRNWDNYQTRLIEHGVLLDSLAINYYKSPNIPWKK